MNWRERLPTTRGRLALDEPLAPFTWLRVGGRADALFLPADEADLAAFLAALPSGVPVTVMGVGSNLIVRDGGIEGVVIRLAGRSFAAVSAGPGEDRVTAGAATLDAGLARAAARAGLAGLEFYVGIPGSVGGALAMNAGCYGGDTSQVLVTARGVDRAGRTRQFVVGDLAFAYRRCGAPTDVIWTEAVFRAYPDEPEAVAGRMSEIVARREASQPIREKTGGSTFKNPPGRSAWRLLDDAGWRGRTRGGAMFSSLHANFLINNGDATAADLETLGEAAREDVVRRFGVHLEWELRRLGRG